MQTRRAFIQTGVVTVGALALGPRFWRDALAGPAKQGLGPYGPPAGSPDPFGITVPEGFSTRLIAKGGAPVPGTAYDFPIFPDGAATYQLDGGGFILAVNSETPISPDVPVIPPIGGGTTGGGGASAIRFRPDGSIESAYRILSGTNTNCAGGKTPWGTWMSCEETDGGHVWECDPTGQKAAIEHPAMGTFKHEAIAVDPAGKRIYLTEDTGDSGFYRFTPNNYPDCSSGLLEIALVDSNGVVTWNRVPDPNAGSKPTRKQVPMTEFKRGEGIWFDSGIVYVATTSDNKIHAYDPISETIEVVYDQRASDGPLNGVDNVTAAPSGDIYVCEDNGTSQIDIGLITPEGEVARFLTASGSQHEQSELTGVCFDPSGKRMFFGAQRSLGGAGAVFEVTGPFRDRQVATPVGAALRLRAHAARTASIDKFRRGGMAVEVTANRSAAATIVIKATIGGKTVTLARTKADLSADKPVRVRLTPTKSARERLKGRKNVSAKISIAAKYAGTGTTDKLAREVRFVKSKS